MGDNATVASITETSTYDGDGVRFSRQVGAGPIIRAVTDPTAGLPVTIDDGSRKYVWGLGLAYAVAGTAIEVQHTDRLGSIRAVTDGTGAVIATYRTDEFGVPTTSTGSAGSPFRFTGEPLDASGLTYLRARHYDASIGRFMSRDPFAGFAAAPLSLNRYSYVGNNPTTSSDPSGLSPSSSVLSGGHSAGFCVNAFGGVAAAGNAVGCLVKDDTGRRALLGTYGFGAVIPWSGLTFAPGLQIANARIDELLGVFVQAGGSRSVGYGGTIGIDVATGEDLRVIVVDVSAGFTLDLPKLFEKMKGEGHILDTNTVIVSEDADLFDAQQFIPVWMLLDAVLAAQSAF